MDKRKLTRLAVVVLGLVAFAGKALWQRTHGTPAEPGADLVQNAGAPGFTLGALAFTPCELDAAHTAATTAAYCAPLRVPEDRAHPEGRQIDLKLALVRGSAPLAARDLVVLLAGGPGQAATAAWSGVASRFAPLLEHRNVLLIDQRGTGGSNALTCKRDPGEIADDQAFDAERVRVQTRACLAEVGKHADPRFYTTTDAIADLEAARAALGSPRFDLVGVSYGTRVAQQYALHHPGAIRSIVLDSAVPNDHSLGSEFAINLDAALKAQFAACSADAACAKAVGDPWANLQRLRERLRAQPVDVAFRDPYTNEPRTQRLGEQSLAGLARMYAYLPETSALLPFGIARALAGDYASLAAQMRMLEREMEELSESAMQLSVVCSEDADRAAPNPADAQTLLGTLFTDTLREQCAIWPHGTRPDDFTHALSGDVPVLIIGGELDPVTPPAYAERIARSLPQSRVLIAKGQGHSVMGRGCFPKLVARFVDTLDAAGLDAGCIADFSATPAFTDYNGAAP